MVARLPCTLLCVFLHPRGLYSRHDLLAVVSRRDLQRLLDSGSVVRVRQGIYASAAMPVETLQAIRSGGVLGCISAAESFGLWRPPDSRVHAHFDRVHSHCRDERHTRHWWRTYDEVQPTRTSLLDTLAHVVRCQPRAFAVAVLDSALHSALISTSDLSELWRRIPARHRFSAQLLDARAESGIESLVRFALHTAGLECESQVVIAGVGRVDLLVEGRVVVEIDGRRWHEGEQERDYERDLVARAARLGSVRVDYPRAVTRPELVVAAVRGALMKPRRVSLPA